MDPALFRRLFLCLMVCLLAELLLPYPGFSDPSGKNAELKIPDKYTSDSALRELNKAIEHRWKNDPGNKDLIQQAQQVRELAEKASDEVILADALLNLVRLYLLSYESTKSLEYALEALKIYREHNDHDKAGYTQMQLGIIYYTQNNYNKSLEYYAEAINSLEKANSSRHIATLFYLSGINYSKLGNFGSAHSFFRRALSHQKAADNAQGMAECYIGIAELFISENQPDSALSVLEEAQIQTGRIHSHNRLYGLAKIDVLTAKAQLLKNNPEQALSAGLKGLQLADSLMTRELILEALGILHEIYSRQGDFQNAHFYLNRYHSLRDSITNENTARKLSELESNFLLRQKQNEILTLEISNRNRTNMLIASFIAALLAVVLILVLLRKNRKEHEINRQLQQAYSDLEKTKNQLVQQEKLASLGQLTAGIAHEIKNPLNFINNISKVSVELLEELKSSDSNTEKEEILHDLQFNLDKIASHGSRANSIMNRMLDHSRTGVHEPQPTDLVKLCDEYFQLSYQAVKLQKPGFYCKLNKQISGQIPRVSVAVHEVARVLINLFNNSLYAIAEIWNTNPEFEPEIFLSVETSGNMLVLKIRDNGPGIPDHLLDKIFQPFFTTKPPGEGTGLGLSISHDIILAHNGVMGVRNHPSGGAEFTIKLPLGS